MSFDPQAYADARRAARAEYLKKKTSQRHAVARAVLDQQVDEIESGVEPTDVITAQLLLQRSREVGVAKGLVTAAQSRLEASTTDEKSNEGEPSLTSYVLPAVEEMEATTATEKVETAAKASEGFVNLTEAEIEKRVVEGDFVPKRSTEEVEKDVSSAYQRRRDNIKAQRAALPVYRVREELMALVKQNPVVVLVGETGSGKTTQVLQYLYEDGFHMKGEEELRLVCTQPRRIAAISVAERVAQEVGSRCGTVVGYKVRFDEKAGPHTRILYVTDGIMLKECANDPSLESVAAIMIDEAHERSLNSDVLLGLLRDLLRRQTHLRVIVASATINADKFSTFFNNAPIFSISGRTFPVEMFYSDSIVADYITESAQTAMALHLDKPLPGDILIFLPGQDAIETCAEALRLCVEEAGEQSRPLLILPIFSSLPPKEQARIYEPTPPGCRKIVIATNIAETSITIDGIVYVIDCGLCKQNYYNPRAMTEELRVVPISQASALQRAGRAGRTQPGECYRLYTSYIFKNELPPETAPEISRCCMSTVVLQLKVLGIDNLLRFDFLDPPSKASLELALDQLFFLGAMKSDGRLTVTGRRMAEFPLEPSLSKALVRSVKLKCGRHMAMAAAMLTLDSVFLNSRDPKEKQNIESAKDVFFSSGNGDVSGYVQLMEAWLRAGSTAAGMEFCRSYSVQWRALSRARDVLDQILSTMDRVGLVMAEDDSPPHEMLHVESFTKALLSGFFYNVARLRADNRTYGVVRPMDTTGGGAVDGEDGDGSTIEIHPTSFLFRSGLSGDGKKAQGGGDLGPRERPVAPVLRERPSLVVFTSLRHTTKRFMVNLTAIASPEWVLEAAPQNYFELDMLQDPASRKRRRAV